MIYYNNSSAWTKVYLGSTEFSKVYSSQGQVFPSGTPPTPSVKYAALFTGGTTSSVTCDHGTTGVLDTTDTSFGGGLNKRAQTLSAYVGDCVSVIGDSAFNGATRLTSVTLPSVVTSIGDYAFLFCGSLTDITIPNSVTSIGTQAFDGCSGLTSIDIPNSVTSIGNSAFSSCRGLTSITIGSGVTSIGNSAFASCSAATSITIYATTPPTLGSYGFRYINANAKIYVPCDSLEAYKTATNWSAYASYMEAIPNSCGGEKYKIYTRLTLIASGSCPPASITKDEVSAYTAATKVELGDCCRVVDEEAFSGYTAMISLTLNSGLTEVKSRGFSLCKKLTTLTIPSSVTSIGQSGFHYCERLASLTFEGEGIQTLGYSAFRYYKGTTLSLPNSLQDMGATCFEDCDNLASVEIGSGITSIGYGAFSGCRSLTSVTIHATTPPTLGTGVFYASNCPIYVPAASVDTYKAATNWSEYASRIQAIPNS